MNRSTNLSPLLGAAGMLFVPAAWGHGGLSSLEGMFELILMVYLQGFIVLFWLVFVGIFVFKQHVNTELFRRFRQVIYTLTAILMLWLVKWLVVDGFNLDVLVVMLGVSAGAVIITEATVWVTRKLRDQLTG